MKYQNVALIHKDFVAISQQQHLQVLELIKTNTNNREWFDFFNISNVFQAVITSHNTTISEMADTAR